MTKAYLFHVWNPFYCTMLPINMDKLASIYSSAQNCKWCSFEEVCVTKRRKKSTNKQRDNLHFRRQLKSQVKATVDYFASMNALFRQKILNYSLGGRHTPRASYLRCKLWSRSHQVFSTKLIMSRINFIFSNLTISYEKS